MKDLEFSSYQEFAEFFNEIIKHVNEDPIENFIKSSFFINLNPTPAQTVLFKCAFGIPLDDEEPHQVRLETQGENDEFKLEYDLMTEVELFEYMSERKYRETDQKVRNEIDLIVGRRGGKTLCSSILALFCAIKMNWKPFLQKVPRATVLLLAQDRDFSQEILMQLKQLIEESPILRRLIDTKSEYSKTEFALAVPFFKEDGSIEFSRVAIKVGTASKKYTRGRAICASICDEISFWNLEENSAENDQAILKALRPGIMQFKEHGILFKISSPGIKQGVLYNDYINRHKLPSSHLVFKAPSWVWNRESILGEKKLQKEHMLDPGAFDSEYRGNFVDSISGFIMPESVDFCVLQGQTYRHPEAENKDIVYCASLDAAFKGDKFTFTLVGWDGHRYRQYIMKVWQGDKANPVQATQVAKYIKNISIEYGIDTVYADQFAFQPLKEIFDQYNLILEEKTFTSSFKKKIYYNLKNAIHNHKMDLVEHPIMIREIKQLQVEKTSIGTIKIGHPNGGSDDCADALAMAAFILSQSAGAHVASGEIAVSEDYDVPVDSQGRAFKGPPPSMLTEYYGEDIRDNSGEYKIDPETGELVKDEDEEDDGPNEGGADVVFA